MLKRAYLFILAAVMSVSVSYGTVLALSPEQLKVYNSGIYYFDVAASLDCNNLINIQGSEATGSVADFISTYADAAFQTGKAYGIPYDAILAQAALESSWGNSKLTREANNFFGIKAGSSWDGLIYTSRTREEDSAGNSYYVVADFRAWPTAEAGFRGYGDFVHGSSYYRDALAYPNDPIEYIKHLVDKDEPGEKAWATDLEYVSKLTKIVATVQKYVAENLSLPPSSEVIPDVSPPEGVTLSLDLNCSNVSTTASLSSLDGLSSYELALEIRDNPSIRLAGGTPTTSINTVLGGDDDYVDRDLLAVLVLLGREHTFTISSLRRTEALSVGGGTSSRHLVGKAADISGSAGIDGVVYGYETNNPVIKQFIIDGATLLPSYSSTDSGAMCGVGSPSTIINKDLGSPFEGCRVFFDKGTAPHVHFDVPRTGGVE